MAKATEDSLGDLHGAVADFLSDKIASGEATAAEIAQAIRFLKDNNIEADKDNPGLRRLSENIHPFPVMDEDEKDQYGT